MVASIISSVSIAQIVLRGFKNTYFVLLAMFLSCDLSNFSRIISFFSEALFLILLKLSFCMSEVSK